MKTSEHVQREIEELAKDLGREDEMGAVVRAHIRIERIVFQLVEMQLAVPANIKRMNLDYGGYVNLALALGLDEQYGPSLRAMGSLRNKFAHQIGSSLDMSTVNSLYGSLRPEDKQQVQASFAHIRKENEQVQVIKKYSELSPKDQFQLIAVVLWTSMRAVVLKLEAAQNA